MRKTEDSQNLSLFTKLILIFFVYIIVYFISFAFTYPAPDGDSINYHIPIAKSFLDGTFIDPEKINAVPFLKYSPGSSEGILSIFLSFNIPMQLYNVTAVLFLFVVLYKVGRVFGLDRNLSLVFGVSVSTLPAMLRWINMEIIDIWMAGFFAMSLLLLEKPRKSIKYFLTLGFAAGMLIGSKYSGPLFAVILFLFYFRKIIPYLNIKRIISFLIPFSVFGLFWYIRNLYLTGNPLYPQPFLFFKGDRFPILETPVLETMLFTSGGIKNFVDAAFSEYSLWIVSFFVALYVVYKWLNKRKLSKATFVALIGLANFIVYLFLPSDKYFHIFVSVVRYSFPAIVPLVLSTFLFAKEKSKEELVCLITFVTLLASPIYQYHPKVLIIVLPIAFFILFPDELQRFKIKISNKK